MPASSQNSRGSALAGRVLLDVRDDRAVEELADGAAEGLVVLVVDGALHGSNSTGPGTLDEPAGHDVPTPSSTERDQGRGQEDRVDRGVQHAGRQVLAGPGRCRPVRAATTELAIAPKTATPTALPTERANMLAPVTTPRCCQSTEDCAATTAGLATKPKPRPITKQGAARCEQRGCRAPTVSSSSGAGDREHRAHEHRGPEADGQVEAAGHGAAAIGQPIVIAASAKPATTAP